MSEGDTAAGAGLAEFCRREHPRLVGALSLYCGDSDVAEELAQEALIRAADRERWAASLCRGCGPYLTAATGSTGACE